METIGELFLKIANKYPDKEVLYYKHAGRYHGIKFREFLQKVEWFALGIESLGFSQGDKVALLSENRPQWMISDLAVIGTGGIDVPLYTSLTPSQVEYIINDSGSKIVVVSKEALLKKILSVRDRLTAVEKIIVIDSVESKNKAEGVITFQEVIETGIKISETGAQRFDEKVKRVKPSDLATIMYTSGTTGVPKGVMLSHSNIVSEVRALSKSIDAGVEDLLISYLPLSHILERLVEYFLIMNGTAVGYCESIESLPRNLMELKPTLLVSVPRVYEKVYSMIVDGLEKGSAFKKRVFDWAVMAGKSYRESDGFKRSSFKYLKYLIAEKYVLSKVKERLGGRLRILISGGASLSKEVGRFFNDLGLAIQEGYGLTETTCAVTLNRRDKIKYGTVGQPLPGVEVAIGDGNEILVRGQVVMQGYYKDEEGTRKVVDQDGWLHTGDVGYMDSDNFLVITDRIKDLIKTSGGKYVAPQQIENLYKTNKFISQAVVIGEGRKYIAALLIPDFDVLKKYSEEEKIPFSGKEDLINNPKIISIYQSITNKINKDLANFEKIRKITLLAIDFSIGSEEVTPTMKLKRSIILKKYKDVIDKMYNEK